VAEDDPVCRSMLLDLLAEEGIRNVCASSNGEDALRLLEKEEFDIVITDLNMPYLRGEVLVREALRLQPHLTVVVVSGQPTLGGTIELIKAGAFEFLGKPFALKEFREILRRAIGRARNQRQAQAVPAVYSLLAALERKDHYLKGHSVRVAKLAGALAREIGLSQPVVRLLERIAVVHDVGKIGVSEAILNKPGRLTEKEWDQIKKHPVWSAEILGPIPELAEGIPFVYHHHERFDGSGYPEGLGGEAIPLEARVIAIADSVDAMASDRSYRPRLSPKEIRAELLRGQGAQFDPELVKVFLRLFPRLLAEGQSSWLTSR